MLTNCAQRRPRETLSSDEQEQLYRETQGRLLEKAVALAQNPFPSTRYASYHVLRSLAMQPWGRKVCLSVCL